MNFLDTILGEILKVFRQEGIEANSDDDLISRLDIRQGTYRELFKDRNEMVRQVVLYDMQEQEKKDQQMLQNAVNPVEEIFLVLQQGIKELRQLNPAYLADLQQHYPEVWQLVVEHLNTYNYHLDLDILNRGILQGYFRKDINLQLVRR
ncbi:TetR/AcrR family transcriptional regulator [Pontibacter rugosus]|uniref:TetR/AcrR family transcriptional regulator n=1 Tax=Pontibacter rugosus TaxID=1745966 RepID=A0ABW3SL09_9BACT